MSLATRGDRQETPIPEVMVVEGEGVVEGAGLDPHLFDRRREVARNAARQDEKTIPAGYTTTDSLYLREIPTCSRCGQVMPVGTLVHGKPVCWPCAGSPESGRAIISEACPTCAGTGEIEVEGTSDGQ